MKFYAIQWTYGRASNSDGTRCGRYYSFDSRESRQNWINQSATDYATQAGYREAISGSDRELRRLLRLDRGVNRINDLNVVHESLIGQI